MRREAAAGVETESAYYSYAADNSLTKRRNQFSGVDTYYFYDNNGARTAMVEGGSPTYYQYGPHGFITAIAPPSEAASYFYYDGRLNRYGINKAGTFTYYLWDGLNLLEERDVSGNLLARYTNGYTQISGIGSVVEVQRAAGGATYYQYLSMDHRGSVYAVTDANQNTQLSYSMDSFGRQLAGIGGANPAVPNSMIYQTNWVTLQIGGKWLGLSPSRIYEIETASFISRDPMATLIRLIGEYAGNTRGIYARTKFLRTIIYATFLDAARYQKWLMNSYRAFSNSPIGQGDVDGFIDLEKLPEGGTGGGLFGVAEDMGEMGPTSGTGSGGAGSGGSAGGASPGSAYESGVYPTQPAPASAPQGGVPSFNPSPIQVAEATAGVAGILLQWSSDLSTEPALDERTGVKGAIRRVDQRELNGLDATAKNRPLTETEARRRRYLRRKLGKTGEDDNECGSCNCSACPDPKGSDAYTPNPVRQVKSPEDCRDACINTKKFVPSQPDAKYYRCSSNMVWVPI